MFYPPLQILGMLLRSKGKMINSNILHLTYTLVGTVDSAHESACIPNPVAFSDLLAGNTRKSWFCTLFIMRVLFYHFYASWQATCTCKLILMRLLCTIDPWLSILVYSPVIRPHTHMHLPPHTPPSPTSSHTSHSPHRSIGVEWDLGGDTTLSVGPLLWVDSSQHPEAGQRRADAQNESGEISCSLIWFVENDSFLSLTSLTFCNTCGSLVQKCLVEFNYVYTCTCSIPPDCTCVSTRCLHLADT